MNERQQNQDAFRQMSSLINRTYPPGRFLAIFGGKVIADGANFAELDVKLRDMGNDSRDVLVVQADVDYPQSLTIFAGESRP